MKIKLLPIMMAILLLPFLTPATHIISGHISYTTDLENPRRIHFVMTHYNNIESTADDPFVEVSMGDGSSVRVERTQYTQISQRSARSLFQWSHTYPTTGSFTVTWNSANRNAGIVNIPQPSDQVSSLITTTVRVGGLFLNKSGPMLAGIPVFDVYVGEPLKHNLLAYDLDGDHLLYSLAVPLHRRNAAGATGPVPGYQFPEGLTINDYGELNWPNPGQKGQYVVAVRITDSRNEQNISTMTVDILFNVTERTIQPQLSLVNRDRLPVNDDGSIQAWPGQPVKLEYYLRKGTNSNLTLDAKSFGEVDSLKLTAAALQLRDTVDGFAVTYTFTPSQQMERPTPYLFGMRGKSQTGGALTGNNRFEFNWNWAYVYVGTERPLSSGDTPDSGIFRPYPNPVQNRFSLQAPDLPALYLQLRDATGKVVAGYQLQPGANTLTRPTQLAAGLYFYTLTSRLAPVGNGKLVLQ